MRFTSKGRAARRARDLRRAGRQAGTEPAFGLDDAAGGPAAAGPRPAQVEIGRLVDRLRGSATAGLSTDEVMALTRGE
jgi:hypothetical protein